MKNKILILLAILSFALCIFILVLHFLSDTVNGAPHNAKVHFEQLNTPYELASFNWNGQTIKYCSTGLEDSGAPVLLFVHGAPGSWEAFKSYLADYDLRHKAHLVSIDRPGYGYKVSSQPVLSIEEQADLIKALITHLGSPDVYLIGHSYGGPVVAMVGALYPELVDKVLMVSPLNDPDNEPVKWYAHLADLKLSRWLLPHYINVATTEKMSHVNQLKAIENEWSKINVPIIHYHGKTDALAPFDANVNFSRQHIPKPFLRIIEDENEGHLVPFNKPGTIKQIILEMMEP